MATGGQSPREAWNGGLPGRGAGKSADVVHFGIALKPRRFANSWERVRSDLHATLRSILAQSDPRFRVVVAYEDLPEGAPEDPRITWLRVESPFPAPVVGGRRIGKADKRLRVTAIGAHLRKLGGGWLMFVDADDLVHRGIVSHVLGHGGADVFLGRFGWEMDVRDGRLRPAPRFWNLCGSSYAIRFGVEELPVRPEARRDDTGILTSFHHGLWKRICEREGKRIRSFPFPVAIYRIFTGDNLSLSREFQHGWKRAVWRRWVPSFPAFSTIRRGFALSLDGDAPLAEPASAGVRP